MIKNKEVLINIYTESSQLKSHKKLKPSNKRNTTVIPRSQGYDRRAQMLAYAQELRHGNAQQIQRPFRVNSRPKQKGQRWRWSRPMEKIRLLFSRFRGGTNKGCKYEQIVTEDCDQMKIKRSKCSNLSRKFKCFFKDIAKSCKCKGTCFG